MKPLKWWRRCVYPSPLRVAYGVRCGQVAPKAVAQQDHALQAYCLPPLLDGGDRLFFSQLGVRGKGGPRAPAKAQQVEGMDRPRAAKRVQIADPQTYAASKTMYHHQRSFGDWEREREKGTDCEELDEVLYAIALRRKSTDYQGEQRKQS